MGKHSTAWGEIKPDTELSGMIAAVKKNTHHLKAYRNGLFYFFIIAILSSFLQLVI